MANRRVIRKTFVLIGGTVLLLLGIIGIIVPIMPGVLFLVAALLLLSTEFEWADRALGSAREWMAKRRLDRSNDRLLRADRDEETSSLDDHQA